MFFFFNVNKLDSELRSQDFEFIVCFVKEEETETHTPTQSHTNTLSDYCTLQVDI